MAIPRRFEPLSCSVKGLRASMKMSKFEIKKVLSGKQTRKAKRSIANGMWLENTSTRLDHFPEFLKSYTPWAYCLGKIARFHGIRRYLPLVKFWNSPKYHKQRSGEWYLESFGLSGAGFYPKRPAETMLLFVNTTRKLKMLLVNISNLPEILLVSASHL